MSITQKSDFIDELYLHRLILKSMYKERALYEKIKGHLHRKEFTIITGARQTGKTTILKQLYLELKKKKQDVWLVSFEKQDVLTKINENPENLFRFTSRPSNSLMVQDKKVIYILIDEIQYARFPTNFLKYLYDTYAPNLKIIATGSSSFYIDKKFKDSLVGRKKIFTLSILSFTEFLIFKNRKALVSEIETSQKRKDYISLQISEIQQLYDEYMIYGGYPAVVLSANINEKIEMLDEIKNSFIKKDIIDSGVENENKFYQLMILLAAQTGNLVNKNEISKTLNIHIKTVENYLYVLLKSFHIDIVKPFHKNIRKEIIKMPKIYFNDLGLRNSLINSFSDIKIRTDKGELFENYIYCRLKEIYGSINIKFWRTADRNEVDFIISELSGNLKAYEVKINPKNIKMSKYNPFKNSYPKINLNFITYFHDKMDKSIYFINL